MLDERMDKEQIRGRDNGIALAPLAYPFAAGETPTLAEVGGKAMSLISMAQRGLPVPPGFVLTVAFFEPWLDQIRRSPEWRDALRALSQGLGRKTAIVKERCAGLELDGARKAFLAKALASLGVDGRSGLLAVRSSSPEEDLEELSFAGGYETVLGVKAEGLDHAVRRCFASVFDERVLVYKQEHGLAVDNPRIAVIVQQQIPAEVAGVAFSLNPINNCYDEAVINANFGLGESVVAGLVSPDSFTVDKVSRTILERKLGKKETSVWLEPNGGTYREPSPARAGFCLSDRQVLELADMVAQVEGIYQKPMDVEWAFAATAQARPKLHLLQARPITAYVPLPEALLTAPGEQKRLYIDLTLVKWGMHEPVSVMGTDYLDIANLEMLRFTMGPHVTPELLRAVRPSVGGRTYVVISNSIKAQGKERVRSEFREMDPVSGEIIAHIDEAEYLPEQVPPALKGVIFKMLLQNLGLLWRVLQALRDPQAFKGTYLREEAQLHEDLAAQAAERDGLSTREFASRAMARMMSYTRVFMPILIAAIVARSRMKGVFKKDAPEIREQVVYLERALPDNVTIEMGLAMYRLANFEEVRTCASGEEFAARLKVRAFSPAFLTAWDRFAAKYGFRSPMEMDPAALRFREQPAQFFEQLRLMAGNTAPESNPQAIYERARTERERAYQVLLEAARAKGRGKAKRFARNYATWIDLGGFRESPKYYFSLITAMVRDRVLDAARDLVAAGRLDRPAQAFDLHIDELDRALADPSLDLRALSQENTRFLNRLKKVSSLPRIIDSRGKILHPSTKVAGEGELAGEPISPGVVQGKVKVLHEPGEKPVLPGEILVTRTTDPGWTPLFINAGGVILEVGGMLQHGALVAREYGKPCVAGIENATGLLEDGQIVELDGASGIVRLLSGASIARREGNHGA
jgi:phosphohistidine swiveling domain-containing protein